jgi:predicted O-methyltransferase YrrM
VEPPATTLDWIAEDEFTIGDVQYACRRFHGHFKSTPRRLCLHKPPDLVRRLEELIRGSGARTIVELGIFEGGSTGFIAQALEPERLICFDRSEPKPAFEQMLVEQDLGEVVRPHWGIDQSDGDRLRAIVREEIGEAPIDLVIDDASHLLEPTRASFDALFPLLRPGGLFLVEDWAWAHGITNHWPHQTPLSSFIFELILANAHRPEAVERVDVDRDWTIVTRGPRELDDDFSLLEHCGARGRSLLPPEGAGSDRGTGSRLRRWTRRLAGDRS